MNCPKCSSESYVKDGFAQKKQRYLCKQCEYRYTVAYRGKPIELKRFALVLYLEGLGFRSIERVINVSNVTIMRWIRSYGKEIERLRKQDNEIEVIEIDEMHTYIGSKKTIVGYGLLLTDMESDTLISYLVQGGKRLVESCGRR